MSAVKDFLLTFERVLKMINIDSIGATEKLFLDENFKLHMQIILIETNINFSSKQIVFFKFIKQYYSYLYLDNDHPFTEGIKFLLENISKY